MPLTNSTEFLCQFLQVSLIFLQSRYCYLHIVLFSTSIQHYPHNSIPKLQTLAVISVTAPSINRLNSHTNIVHHLSQRTNWVLLYLCWIHIYFVSYYKIYSTFYVVDDKLILNPPCILKLYPTSPFTGTHVCIFIKLLEEASQSTVMAEMPPSYSVHN